MSDFLAKAAKRRLWPCVLPNGEEIKVRPLTFGETTRLKLLTDDAKHGFSLGKVCMGDDGSQGYPQETSESDEEYGLRIAGTCELDQPAIEAIFAAVGKASKPPRQEILQKNLPETTQPDSQSGSVVSPEKATQEIG